MLFMRKSIFAFKSYHTVLSPFLTTVFILKINNRNIDVIRAKMVSPDSPEAAKGINKSKKTILNKTRAEDVFRKSGTLFDLLRKEGCGSVEKYLQDKFRVGESIKFQADESEEENNLKLISPTDYFTDINIRIPWRKEGLVGREMTE